MRYGSVCSGIEAASCAWEPLGWTPAWFAETADFPSRVLAARFPQVANLGDLTTLPARVARGEVEAPDVLVGGTPCQAFSYAGARRSLDDARGQLTLSFVELADAIDTVRTAAGLPPCTIVWENVVGALTTRDNAFGHLLGALAGEEHPLFPSGTRWTHAGVVLGPARRLAWRVLDAQHFGVPQQRRRVYVVASAGNVDPAEVLFERQGLPGHPAARADAVAQAAASAAAGAGGNRLACVTNAEGGALHLPFLTASNLAKTVNNQTPLLVFDGVPAVAGTLCADAHPGSYSGQDAYGNRLIPHGGAVRRFTPTECERLMGFADGWTDVDGASDSARYRALGNSMAVPVIAWIGARMAAWPTC